MFPTLAILAGGQSRRMGFPKSAIRIAGTPILEYLLSRFRWPGPTLLVTSPASPRPPGWNCFDREVSDPEPGIGPLRGVLTALEQSPATEVLVTTVDMPCMGPEQLYWLVESCRRLEDALGLMLTHDGTTANAVEPFPSIFRPDAAPILRARLAADHRSVHGLLHCPGFLSLPAPTNWSQRIWTNLNHPADLEMFLAQQSSQIAEG